MRRRSARRLSAKSPCCMLRRRGQRNNSGFPGTVIRVICFQGLAPAVVHLTRLMLAGNASEVEAVGEGQEIVLDPLDLVLEVEAGLARPAAAAGMIALLHGVGDPAGEVQHCRDLEAGDQRKLGVVRVR